MELQVIITPCHACSTGLRAVDFCVCLKLFCTTAYGLIQSSTNSTTITPELNKQTH